MATIKGTKGSDNLNGTTSDDVFIGLGGQDTFNGGDGSDVFVMGPGGDDFINGGVDPDDNDIDQVVLNGSYSNYDFSYDGLGNLVASVGAVDETMTGVESIIFDDQQVIVVGANSAFQTIQEAVNFAGDGAIIMVEAGTYAEQLVVDGKNNLTIMAMPGDEVTIQAPADVVETARSSSGRELNGVVTVMNSSNVVLKNVNVDGAGAGATVDENDGVGQANFIGVVYRNASGDLIDVDVTGVRDGGPTGTLNGVQRGVGIQVDNDSLMHFGMSGGSISDFQKNATVFNGADLDVTEVTVTGAGATTAIAQNGFQVSNSTGSFSGNTVQDIGYAGLADAYSGSFLLFDNTDLSVTDNVIIGTNDETADAKVVGVYLFGSNSGGAITGNTISYVDTGIGVYDVIGPNNITIEDNNVSAIDLDDPYAAGVDFEPMADSVTAYTVQGTSEGDILLGGAAGDTFTGLGGDDYIDGRGGADSMIGGGGDDSYVVDDAAGDIVTEQTGEGTDTVIAQVTGYTLAGNVENLVLDGTVAAGSGNGGDNTITGNTSDNTISGGGGNDMIDGGGGIDTATYAGSATITENRSSWNVTDAGGTDTLTGVEIVDDAGAGKTLLVGLGGFATIQDAINAAASGDTIVIASGNYDLTSPLLINKDLTFLGANAGAAGDGARGAETTLNSIGNSQLIELADSAITVSFDGFQFVGQSMLDEGTPGQSLTLGNSVFDLTTDGQNPSIYVGYGGGYDFSFNDNLVRSTGYSDGLVFVQEGGVFNASGNSFVGQSAPGGNAVAINWGSANGSVSNNSFDNIDIGILLANDTSGPVTIDGNTFSNLTRATPGSYAAGVVLFQPSYDDNVTISNNVFEDSDAGIRTSLADGSDLDLLDIDIVGNTFDNNVVDIRSAPLGTLSAIDSTVDGDNVNLIVGGNDDSVLDGVVGGDTNVDLILGGEGNDTIDGKSGADQLYGEAGNDTLIVDGDDTIIDGGADIDTAVIAGDFTGYSLDFGAPGVITLTDTDPSDGDDGTYTLTSIETLQFDDTRVLIVDASGANGGYTTIQSAVDAADPGDTVVVLAGTYTENVTITEGITIQGAFAGVEGASGSRTASSAAGETNLIGNITISGGALVTIDGLRFQENNAAQNGYGQIHATSGNVLLTNNVFYSTVNGGATEVRAIYVNPGSGGTATITENYITGAFASGYSGASYRRGIWYDGQNGSNVVVDGNTIENSRAGINADLNGASALLVEDNYFHTCGTGTAVGYDTDGLSLVNNSYLDTGEELNLRNITTPITYDASDDVLSIAVTSGTAYYNILGGTAADTITGTAFNDLIEGNQLFPTTGTDGDTFYGLAGADILLGEGGDDFLYGGDDGDTIDGGLGNDLLDGGTGADALTGGAGDDTYVVDDAGDSVTELAAEGTDLVQTTLAAYTLGANLENLTYTGAGNFNGTGNGGANIITGGDGADTLIGLGGADMLVGGAGNDRFSGGSGADTMIGGDGNDGYLIDGADTVTELANGGRDTVKGAMSINLNDAAYANIENAILSGNAGYDVTGTADVNALTGNKKANVITGGGGADDLTGGNGNDRFVYSDVSDSGSATGASDRISDFKETNSNGVAGDLIDLFAIDAKANSAGNNAFTFIGTDAFTAEGQIRYFMSASGNTIIAINTDDAHAGAEMQIILEGAHTITDADFVL